MLPLPYEFTLTFQRAVPFVQTIVGQTNPGEFPTGAFQQAQSMNRTSGLAYYPESNPKRNYVMQWNLSVARELSVHSGGYGRLRGIAGSPPALPRRQHRHGSPHAHFGRLYVALWTRWDRQHVRFGLLAERTQPTTVL